MTKGNPPGGRLLGFAKRVGEEVLWNRVALQVTVERRSPSTLARPLPSSVPQVAVLRRRSEWEAAVAEARRLRLPLHPDRVKNWDALGAVRAVLVHAGQSARVLDAGSARYSMVLPWLRLYGLTDLVGINLEFSGQVRHGPVRFEYGDITAADFLDSSFDAITCLSVIEHGVHAPKFFAEAARLLRPGGILSVSTDYDQHPSDTGGKVMYGVPVRIFGPAEVRALVCEAEEQGFCLAGELALEHEERPVHWSRLGLDYTFILLTFIRV